MPVLRSPTSLSWTTAPRASHYSYLVKRLAPLEVEGRGWVDAKEPRAALEFTPGRDSIQVLAHGGLLSERGAYVFDIAPR